MTPVILKEGREKSALRQHPWIFSGAIKSAPSDRNGEIHPVHSFDGRPLGFAYFNSRSQLFGRFVSFGEEDPYVAIRRHLKEAVSKRVFTPETTTWRLVNGEGDFLPGLVVDKYGDLLVVQISTLGMERLKPLILEELQGPIWEKSNLPSRKEEGLAPSEGWLRGEGNPAREVLENGIKYLVNPQEGQKTGFFLDQRENRARIGALAKGKRVLNAFSYTGGFTLSALKGGAVFAHSVDISEKACRLVRENIALNGFEPQEVFEEDVFEFLRRRPLDYDLVILDPPAFAKREKEVIQACRGYKEINRQAIAKMPKGSLLLTCSCSHFVDEALFQKVVFQASNEAGRECQILGRHLMAADHPLNLCHPEGDYLKSLLLYVN